MRKFKGVIPELKSLGNKIASKVMPANGGISAEYKKLRDAEIWYQNVLGLFLTTPTEMPPIGGVALVVDNTKETDLVSPIRIATSTLSDLYDRANATSKVDLIQIYVEAVKMLPQEYYQKLASNVTNTQDYVNGITSGIIQMTGVKFDGSSSKIRIIVRALGGKQMASFRLKDAIIAYLDDVMIQPSKCYTCKNCKYVSKYGVPMCFQGHIPVPDDLTVKDINNIYPEVYTYRKFNPHGKIMGSYGKTAVTVSEYIPLPLEECPHNKYICR